MTNIFGTAHAQFSNMLILSATYMQIISFLLQSRYISPSLQADARILTEIYEKIFGDPAMGFST
ncbi:uncharacterized protein NFIA_112480 [Aspergillus fischeri NRRL 181]|uniref:Uncharacterized protein n=1 Tax=Neosartorya fischeri (strain ATCC 1020 / DSM 3700 / CBS 544.65 / FGSC A1164 / JCM 1740 / NRRL 181 / WB 181) TaxID=331117 RepID=A1D8L3_NEOFI|nr:uncharacterized protein NFIA_112480 [Aspergillus fischeri NRRL 181]EAW20724.1 hypothetical protein NFIA_112480 [Aspergillus fischeri NRRL 181]